MRRLKHSLFTLGFAALLIFLFLIIERIIERT